MTQEGGNPLLPPKSASNKYHQTGIGSTTTGNHSFILQRHSNRKLDADKILRRIFEILNYDKNIIFVTGGLV